MAGGLTIAGLAPASATDVTLDFGNIGADGGAVYASGCVLPGQVEHTSASARSPSGPDTALVLDNLTYNNIGYNSVSLTIESMQGGEGAYIYGSSRAGLVVMETKPSLRAERSNPAATGIALRSLDRHLASLPR